MVVHESTASNAACDSKLMELYRLVSLLKNDKELENEYMNMGWVAAEAEERGREEGIIAAIKLLLSCEKPLDEALSIVASQFGISAQEAERIYFSKASV